MENKILTINAKKWFNLTEQMLDEKVVPYKEIQIVLKDSFYILNEYRKQNQVPKEISRILLNIKDFLKEVSMVEFFDEFSTFSSYPALYSMTVALEKGFFNEKDNYKYPKLEVEFDNGKIQIFDFEKDDLEEFVHI